MTASRPTPTCRRSSRSSDLCIQFPRHGDVNVVDHLSFVVRPRQTMGLVGESGCGKSITSLAIMGLLDPKAKISGEILYDGKNLLEMSQQASSMPCAAARSPWSTRTPCPRSTPRCSSSAQMKQLTKRGGTRTAEELLELVGLDPKRTLGLLPPRALRRPAPARAHRHGAHA